MVRYFALLIGLALTGCDYCGRQNDIDLSISDSSFHAFASAGNSSLYTLSSAETGLPVDSLVIQNHHAWKRAFNGNVGSCAHYLQDQVAYKMRSLTTRDSLAFALTGRNDASDFELVEVSGSYAGVPVFGQLKYWTQDGHYTFGQGQSAFPVDSLKLGNRIFRKVFLLPASPEGDTSGHLIYMASGVGLVGIRLKDSASTQLLYVSKASLVAP